MISAIVSVAEHNAIGKDGGLIVPNRADMLRFKELTMGGVVVMGRSTFESFPHGALPGRENIVLTSQTAWQAPHVKVAHSVDEALLLAHAFEKPIWIIGGERVYREFLLHTDRIYLTHNHIEVPGADAFFCELGPEWVLVASQDGGITKAGVSFEYLTYERVAS